MMPTSHPGSPQHAGASNADPGGGRASHGQTSSEPTLPVRSHMLMSLRFLCAPVVVSGQGGGASPDSPDNTTHDAGMTAESSSSAATHSSSLPKQLADLAEAHREYMKERRRENRREKSAKTREQLQEELVALKESIQPLMAQASGHGSCGEQVRGAEECPTAPDLAAAANGQHLGPTGAGVPVASEEAAQPPDQGIISKPWGTIWEAQETIGRLEGRLAKFGRRSGGAGKLKWIPEAGMPPGLTCTYCSVSFAHRDYLSKHYRRHTKPHQCAYCGKRFGVPWEMRKHQASQHGVARSPAPRAGLVTPYPIATA